MTWSDLQEPAIVHYNITVSWLASCNLHRGRGKHSIQIKS